MDTAQISSELAPYLIAAWPALKLLATEVAEGAAGELGKKAVGDAWEKIKALWGKAEPELKRRGGVEALQDAAEGKPGARSALEYQLRKVLEAEPQLAEEAQQAVRSLKKFDIRVVSAKNHAMAAGRDIRKSQIGDNRRRDD